MNTKIELMYRDGDNYKAFITVVVSGVITDEQTATMQEGLTDGHFIIAEQVGLPTPSEAFMGLDSFPSESDHVYTTVCEFYENEPDASDLHTTDSPTIDMDVGELVRRIDEADWDVGVEMERLGFPSGGG